MERRFVMTKTYRKIAISAAIVSLPLMLWSFSEDLFQISKNLDVFTAVYKEINVNYVDEVNPAKLVKTGVDAMLDNLDPYTEGQEEDLITRLMALVNRKREYVVFTLKKALANIDNNRL